MLHFTAFLQNITRLKNQTDNLEISYPLNEFGYWGGIKDTNAAEFYTRYPYENVPAEQYGFFGLFKDDNSNIADSFEINKSNNEASSTNQHSNYLGNKCVNNLLNIVKSNEKFDYKYKFTIDKVKYKKANNDNQAEESSNNDLYEEEILIPFSNKNINNQRIDFLHFSNIFTENTDDDIFLDNLLQIKNICNILTKKYNPIKFYSGDILFPSYLSTFHKLLNSIKFHAGIYGLNDVRSNSLNLLEDSVDKTNSIWLMSNLFHVKKQYLAITKCSIMMIIENKNVKIGIIGLMHTNDLNQSQIKYVDYLHEANRLSNELVKRGVHIIIALTQMSWLHDEFLANNASKIDLIFGCGDDFEYGIREVNNRWIVKSGVNNKNLSLIKIEFNEQLNKIMDLSIVKINVKENKAK